MPDRALAKLQKHYEVSVLYGRRLVIYTKQYGIVDYYDQFDLINIRRDKGGFVRGGLGWINDHLLEPIEQPVSYGDEPQ